MKLLELLRSSLFIAALTGCNQSQTERDKQMIIRFKAKPKNGEVSIPKNIGFDSVVGQMVNDFYFKKAYRAYRKAGGATIFKLSNLPQNVTVDSGFLCIVTVDI